MEPSRLKYRIVGGIVLVSLLAILAPAVNDLRQPVPQGPQAIDIPDEPADGVARMLPADGPPVTGTLPEPQDIPPPAPPPSYDAREVPQVEAVTAEPSQAPAEPAPAPAAVRKPPASVTPQTATAPVIKPAPTVAGKPAVAKAVPDPAPKKVTSAPASPAPVVAIPSPAATSRKSVMAPPAVVPTTPPAAATQQAWVVQLGTFSSTKTAVDLRERLRKAGFSAFTEQVSTPEGAALRVRVGPEIDRAASQALRDRLVRETGQNAIVMPYP